MGLVLLDLYPTDFALSSLLSMNIKLHSIIECLKVQTRLGGFAARRVLLYPLFLVRLSSIINFGSIVRVCSVLYFRCRYFQCSTPQLTCIIASRGLNRLSVPIFASPRNSTEVLHSHLSCASPGTAGHNEIDEPIPGLKIKTCTSGLNEWTPDNCRAIVANLVLGIQDS